MLAQQQLHANLTEQFIVNLCCAVNIQIATWLHIYNYASEQLAMYTINICCSDLEKIASGIGDKLAYTMQAIIQMITGLIVGFIYLWQLALLFIGCIPLLIVAGVIVERVSKCYSRLCAATVATTYVCLCQLLQLSIISKDKCLYLNNSDDWQLANTGIQYSVIKLYMHCVVHIYIAHC